MNPDERAFWLFILALFALIVGGAAWFAVSLGRDEGSRLNAEEQAALQEARDRYSVAWPRYINFYPASSRSPDESRVSQFRQKATGVPG